MDDEIKIEIGEDFRSRIELHFELMDKYSLSHLRAACEIEFLLIQALEIKFANPLSVQKVVGDSFARIVHLSYALGVIKQKTYESLQSFRATRNRIAHKVNPNIKLKDTLAMVKFLGSDAEAEIQKRGSFLAAWHQAALELLVEHVKSEVLA